MKKINLIIIALLSCSSAFLISEEKTIFDDVRAGDIYGLKERIAKKENCAVVDADGNTVLHIAAQEGHEKSEEIITILTTEPSYSWFSFTDWGNWGYDKIVGGPTLPDKDAQNKNGDTPFHVALAQGNEKETKCLLEKKVRTDIKNAAGYAPAFAVVNNQKRNSIALLIKYELIDAQEDGDNLVHYAIKKGKTYSLRCLLEHKKSLADEQNGQGKTAAILAAELSTTDMLKLLHEHGINFNIPGHYGRRPLHYSSQAGNLITTTFLLQHGASSEVVDTDGDSPLHYSAAQGQLNTTDILLAYKADITRANKWGKNPFTLAVHNNHTAVVKRFSTHPDHNINAQDVHGRTVFMNETYAGNHSMMRELLKCGVHIGIKDKEGNTSLHLAAAKGNTEAATIILEKDRTLLSYLNNQGNNPLFVAAESGNRDMVWLFNRWGQSLHEKNERGESILHQVAKSTNKQLFDEVFYAYNDPSALSMQDNNGNTVPHAAVLSAKKDMILHFKEKAPYLFDVRNKQSDTPFLYAVRNGRSKMVEYFTENEKYFINGDVRRGIVIAEHSGYHNIKRLLKSAEDERHNKWNKLNDYYRSVEMTINENKQLYSQLYMKSPRDFNGVYGSILPPYYSKEEFYHLPDAQRITIIQVCVDRLNVELANKNHFVRQLNFLINKENEEQARKAQQALKEQQDGYNTINAQHVEIKHYEKENKPVANVVKVSDATKAEQQAILDQCAAAKAAEGRAQQKHQQALEGQHVPLTHPEPSAPPMYDDVAVNACGKCGKELPKTKPVPCGKCRKEITDMCAACNREHNKSRCASCLEIFKLGIEKKKGECGFCLEKNVEVTMIPCKHCKKESSTARICSECLQQHLEHVKKIGIPHKCPQCPDKEGLMDDLLQKLFPEDKK